jgi:DNA gyrase/topoisomerase IV subunit A
MEEWKKEMDELEIKDRELSLRCFIPDARDGLTLLQRTVLYTIHSMNLTPESSHKKSANAVGGAMSCVDPEGKIANCMYYYEELVKLAQPWTRRYPLIDGHGNFGTEDGAEPANFMHTEVRMKPITTRCFSNIAYDTVDFEVDEDGENLCPKVLPGLLPNILINGANGKTGDIETYIPPHNLSEVVDAIVKVIDEPGTTIEELCKIIKGPDYPFGGILKRDSQLESAYLTGEGSVVFQRPTSISYEKVCNPIKMVALVDGEPKTLNLREIIDLYIAHQKDVVTRKIRYEKKIAESRIHVLNGYKYALEHIDEIAKLAMADADIQESLVRKLNFTSVQASAVSCATLSDVRGFAKEYKRISDNISRLDEILRDESRIMGIIKKYLIQLKEMFGDKRRTEVIYVNSCEE